MRKFLLFALMLAVCAMFATPLIAADDSNLAARAAAWEKEYNAGNLAGVVALYAADGFRMPPNVETFHGPDAILAGLKKGVALGGAKIKVTVTSSESSGDIAHGYGTFELTAKDGSHVDHGKWMNISKKTGGTWKIQCDIWNSDMPLPTGEMKK